MLMSLTGMFASVCECLCVNVFKCVFADVWLGMCVCVSAFSKWVCVCANLFHQTSSKLHLPIKVCAYECVIRNVCKCEWDSLCVCVNFFFQYTSIKVTCTISPLGVFARLCVCVLLWMCGWCVSMFFDRKVTYFNSRNITDIHTYGSIL